MSDLNVIALSGRLVRDPELRYLPNGTALVNTALAINRTHKKDGEKREEVSFIDLTVFGKTAEILAKYKKKGDQILVSGEIRQERWESKDGEKRSKIVVIGNNITFIGKGSADAPASDSGNETTTEVPAAGGEDDCVPF